MEETLYTVFFVEINNSSTSISKREMCTRGIGVSGLTYFHSNWQNDKPYISGCLGIDAFLSEEEAKKYILENAYRTLANSRKSIATTKRQIQIWG